MDSLLRQARRFVAKSRVALLVAAAIAVVLFTLYSYTIPPPYLARMIGGTHDSWLAMTHYFYTDHAIHEGDLPLWNPLIFCGTPHAANPLLSTFYPPYLLRSLLTFSPTPLKTHIGMRVVLVLHILLAGVSTFFLARDYKISVGGAAVATIAFIFSGGFVRYTLEAWAFIDVVAWLPLMLLLLRKMMLYGDLLTRFKVAIVCGFLCGVSILSGMGQMSYYISLTLVAYVIILRFTRSAGDKQTDIQPAKALVVDLSLVLVLHLVAVLTAAATLLPALEFIGFTGRAKSSGLVLEEYELYSSIGEALAQFVSYASPYRLEYAMTSGAGTLLVILGSFRHPRKKCIIGLLALFLVLLDLSIGPPAPIATFVGYLMPFQVTFHSRAMLLACLPLALLAGMGVDSSLSALTSRRGRLLNFALVLGGGGIVLTTLAFQVLFPTFLHVSKLALVFPFIILVVMLLKEWFHFRYIHQLLLPVLIFLEIAVWNHEYVPYLLTRFTFFEVEFGESLEYLSGEREFWNDNYRGISRLPNRKMYDLEPEIGGYFPLYINRTRSVLCSPGRESVCKRFVRCDEVTRDNQRGNLFLKRSFWLARQYVEGALPAKDALFPPTTTVYLQGAPELPLPRVEQGQVSLRSVSAQTRILAMPESDLSLVQSNKDNKLLGVSLPSVDVSMQHAALMLRYTSTGDAELVAEFVEEGSLERVSGKRCFLTSTGEKSGMLEIPLPSFDIVQTSISVKLKNAGVKVNLEKAYVEVDTADENNLISVLSRRPNSVELEVKDLPEHRILLFVDSAYPGWKASVDGEPAEIYLANDAFKAVIVPPGTHTVRFVFRPLSVYLGIVVTCATVVVVAFILFLIGRRSRQATADKS